MLVIVDLNPTQHHGRHVKEEAKNYREAYDDVAQPEDVAPGA